jgi:hypothetical protein
MSNKAFWNFVKGAVVVWIINKIVDSAWDS